jgi:hypothetical protein
VGRGLRGHDELAWGARLMAELDNLRSAVLWGLDSGTEEDHQTAVSIVAWLANESLTRATGIGRWAEQAIPALQRASAPGYRAAVLGAAAAQARGDFQASERYARAALEEGYRSDDPSPCLASIYLAVSLVHQGRMGDAARHLDAAEAAIVGRDDEDNYCSWLQTTRVMSGLFADDEDQEIAEARLAMSLAGRTGNPTNLARASQALGLALRHRHPDEASALSTGTWPWPGVPPTPAPLPPRCRWERGWPPGKATPREPKPGSGTRSRSPSETTTGSLLR